MPPQADTDTPALDQALAFVPGLIPAGLFLDGTEHLRITSFNAAAAVTLAIEGRQFVPGHGIVPIAERHVPNTDRSSASSTFTLAPGWLVDVQVRASVGTPRRGQCFVVVEIVRGFPNANAAPITTLIEGYVTDTSRRAWPRSPLELMPDGFGVLRSITGTDPAANAEISEACPTNARWRVLAIRFTLVTDGTAANREVAITVDDGANVYARLPSRLAHVATTTIAYTCVTNAALEAVAQDTERLIRLPPIELQGGHRFNTVTTARQVGDNYSAPQYLVEEKIED